MKRKVLKMEKKNPTSCGVEASTLISYVSFVMSLFFSERWWKSKTQNRRKVKKRGREAEGGRERALQNTVPSNLEFDAKNPAGPSTPPPSF